MFFSSIAVEDQVTCMALPFAAQISHHTCLSKDGQASAVACGAASGRAKVSEDVYCNFELLSENGGAGEPSSMEPKIQSCLVGVAAASGLKSAAAAFGFLP